MVPKPPRRRRAGWVRAQPAQRPTRDCGGSIHLGQLLVMPDVWEHHKGVKQSGYDQVKCWMQLIRIKFQGPLDGQGPCACPCSKQGRVTCLLWIFLSSASFGNDETGRKRKHINFKTLVGNSAETSLSGTHQAMERRLSSEAFSGAHPRKTSPYADCMSMCLYVAADAADPNHSSHPSASAQS